MNNFKSLIKPVLIFLFLLVITFPTIKNILRPGYFPMHDDIQAMRVYEMDKCIKDRQIPCRWVPDMGYEYGYPQFNYYGPLPYYIMEAFHLTGFGFLDSVKAGLIVITLVSVFGMFLLGESVWGAPGGLISSILYAFAPYRALDFYVRGDIGELAALAIFPYLFWSVSQVLKGKKNSTFWLGLSFAALLMSHNISTLIFTPILVLWALGQPKFKERFKFLILGGVWGILIGAFFAIPAFFEKGYVHVETLLLGYFNYLAHYVSISQLLFSTYWNYGSSEGGPWDELYLGIGLLHWILPLVSLIVLFVIRKKKEFKTVLFLAILGWLSLFMTHEKSTFIWNHIPFLAYLQFPWRFLILATFLFSLAAGSISQIFKSKKQILITLILLFFSVMIFYSSYFQPRKWLDITDSDKFSGESWTLQTTISIFDYLPIFAKHPPAQKAPNQPIFIQGKGSVLSGNKLSDSQNWQINVDTKSAVVEIPTYYFPIWKVLVDGKEGPIDYNNELGLINFNLVSGKHVVYAKLTNTLIRSAANIATLLGLLAIPIFFAFKIFNKK